MSKSYSMDMCNGAILPKLLRFALPLMCSSILQLLFNAADVVVVGRFCGEHSLAAVGSTASLINLLTNLFMGLSVGANVLVARYFGAREEKRLHDVVHTAIALSIASGAVLTVFGIIFTKQILVWMQTPEEVLGLAAFYLRIYFIGMIAMMLYNFCSSILRAVGDTKRPLYYLLFAGVINVCLNLFFVIVCNLNVAGVGMATVISQCVSAFLIARCLTREKEAYRLCVRDIGFHYKYILKILQIGLPAGLQGTIFSLSNVVIQSSVNSFGAVVMAGNAAAANIEGFVYVAMNSFHQAAVSFVSQNLGAGKFSRINKIAVRSLICVIITGCVLGGLAVLCGYPLLGFYSSKEMVIEAGMVRMKMICGTYALCGMMDVMVGILRGLGYSVMPMIVSLIGACGLRILWIFTIFRIPTFHTTEMLYLSYPISWVITLFVHIVCFLVVRKRFPKTDGPKVV
ncbi:MAG: MATE family efflux transporter [Lachnospiraceae bacterium]|nr:MATE family efflux transporter [Lachnospiraceae bacterium]